MMIHIDNCMNMDYLRQVMYKGIASTNIDYKNSTHTPAINANCKHRYMFWAVTVDLSMEMRPPIIAHGIIGYLGSKIQFLSNVCRAGRHQCVNYCC